MFRSSRNISVMLAVLLTFSVLATVVPALKLPLFSVFPVRASTGNIYINSKTAPSPIITIDIGENISLYFGDVTWSGGQVDLYISSDGYASLTTPGDINYSPTFRTADITNTTAPWKQIVDGDLRYTVGNNWINGTVPVDLEIPGGNYYIKAYDGETAAVAVTDNYIRIVAAFAVAPSYGPGQASVQLKGYALPPNGHANLSYNFGTGWTVIQDLVPADELGRFVYSMAAPDLMMPMTLNPGLVAETSDTITFRMVVNSTGQADTDVFDEYRRGLKQVKGVDLDISQLAADGWLFGNGTNFYSGTYQVNVTVLGDLIIAGKWFHPGTLTLLWNGTIVIGTATANATHGWFNTTVMVPVSSRGRHNVTIDDGKCIFWFDVNVIPTPKPPSPQEALEELVNTIESWNLDTGIENSLTSKLQAAYRSLERENQKASIGQLTAFMNEVRALREKKLTSAQADYLISDAQEIIGLIEG